MTAPYLTFDSEGQALGWMQDGVQALDQKTGQISRQTVRLPFVNGWSNQPYRSFNDGDIAFSPDGREYFDAATSKVNKITGYNGSSDGMPVSQEFNSVADLNNWKQQFFRNDKRSNDLFDSVVNAVPGALDLGVKGGLGAAFGGAGLGEFGVTQGLQTGFAGINTLTAPGASSNFVGDLPLAGDVALNGSVGADTLTGGAGADTLASQGYDPVTMGEKLGSQGNFNFLKDIPWTAVGLGANAVSGLMGASAAKSAAATQAQASREAAATNLGMFNTLNTQQAPYRQAGNTAIGSMLAGFGPTDTPTGISSGQFAHQFNANDLQTNLAPNWQFMRDQWIGAARNTLNLQGGLGGNTLKGVTDYAENYAGNAYQNAFNNYNANQTNIFNRLASIAGFGQTANSQSATSGSTIAGAVGNAQQGVGAAQAAGLVGGANAASGALNNAASWYALSSLLPKNA